MPTVCALKETLKAKGIKGYSGLNKADLMKLVEHGSIAKKTPKTSAPAKKKTTKATSANLNALYQKSKKKPLAITYKEPAKPIATKNFKNNYLYELPDVLISKIKAKAKVKYLNPNETNFKKNYLSELPNDLINKIKKEAKETGYERFRRIMDSSIRMGNLIGVWEGEHEEYISSQIYDIDKADNMSESRRELYDERILEKIEKISRKNTEKIVKLVQKTHSKSSDEDFMEEVFSYGVFDEFIK